MKKTVSFKRSKIQAIHGRLKNASGLSGMELLYARARTLSFLEKPLSDMDMEKVIPETEKFKEYREALNKAYEKASGGKTKSIEVPGPQGVPQVLSSWDLDFNDPSVRKIKEDLEKKYKAEIEKRKEDEKGYRDEFLEKEEEVVLFYVPLKYAPSDQAQFDAVSDILIMVEESLESEWDTLFQKFLDFDNK
jgi:hypothetical protein